jgi:hypothetical protein
MDDITTFTMYGKGRSDTPIHRQSNCKHIEREREREREGERPGGTNKEYLKNSNDDGQGFFPESCVREHGHWAWV